MDLYPIAETLAGTPGAIAPADGNYAPNLAQGASPAVSPGDSPTHGESNALDDFGEERRGNGTASAVGAQGTAPLPGSPVGLGPNNERLEDAKPQLVNALRELVRQYREEGVVARRHEIRRIRQARLFWQGLQYAWWNPNDMNWHLPFEQRFSDDRQLEEMPRYQFVTNFYQGFGLSFIAVLSQDVPSVRFYPQSSQSLGDIAAARSASDVADLIERNNHVEQLLTTIGYFLWTDGKLGAYVRYVADGQRFGFHDEQLLEAVEIPLGEDVYACPNCGKEIPAEPNPVAAALRRGEDDGINPPLQTLLGTPSAPRNLSSFVAQELDASFDSSTDHGSRDTHHIVPDANGNAICPHCGAALSAANLRLVERVTVPRLIGTRRVPNGQEVISIAGGLELNTPVWANEMHEYPYLQWQAEVHRAKLKAAYPHVADKIESSPSQGADDVYARVSRLSVEQGLPSIHPGDALMNLITFDRTWLRPWAFYAVEDQNVRNELLALFPDGCYCAFAGDVYCESRSESMDDHWRVLHALPGDGQNRPSVGDSLVQVQERYNVLSNMQAETYEYGIPPIYADPQVLDFDALANQVAEPAAHFPARARPGQPLAAGFFQPQPARVPPDMVEHQQELIGPVAQFLTGLFPAIFGGNMEDVKTASGYALARDQAMGRLGLVWRRTKQFYADVLLLAVDCFRKSRPEDAEIPLLGPDGALDARSIRTADLKGNICVHPEADETFPRLKSQQRAVLQQLFTLNDPLIQEALTEPANVGYIKNVLGLTELVVPGEDSRNKQLREIQQLLASAPIVVEMPHLDVARDLSSVSRENGRSAAQIESRTPNAGGVDKNQSRQYSAEPSSFDPEPSTLNPSDGEASTEHGSRNTDHVPQQHGPRNEHQPAESAASPNSSLTEHGTRATEHAAATLVLPSVPVDQLLDNHAVEFEECKRWANSEAGQSARMTNPAGFANVRAHAEAHLRAMSVGASTLNHVGPTYGGSASRVHHAAPSKELQTLSQAAVQVAPKESSAHRDGDRDSPGDHWVTIDGNHVLIQESQGKHDEQTPQGLAAKIPCNVKAAIARALDDSNAPTSDDKKRGIP